MSICDIDSPVCGDSTSTIYSLVWSALCHQVKLTPGFRQHAGHFGITRLDACGRLKITVLLWMPGSCVHVCALYVQSLKSSKKQNP